MKLTDMLKPYRTLISADNIFIKEWKRTDRPVLGYACSYTPEEIIYAGGILPVRILGNMDPPKLADVYLPINVCSFAKSGFNKALKGEYRLLDGYVASNCCDNQNKIYDLWQCCLAIPQTYFINTPHSATDKSLVFFHKELERFKEWLTAVFKEEITNENLKNTIKIFNEHRRLLKQVYELRRQDPPLISGSEALDIVLSSMMTPKDKHSEVLKELLDKIETRVDPPKKGVRLLVSGSDMGNSELMRLIESVGGCVVADDLCTGSRYFWNLTNEYKEPMMAIAERYLSKIPCPFMYSSEERFQHVIEMAKTFNVQGILIFSLKCCDVHSFDAPLLAEELAEDDELQVLSLEWEHSLSGIAQLKTRIEAFVEMLRE